MEKTISPSSIRPEWREKFILKRINADDLTITLEDRNALIGAMNDGGRFVQLGKYTIMVNTISAIEPYFPPFNVPKKPSFTALEIASGGDSYKEKQKLIEEWEHTFKNKKGSLNANND